MKILILGLNKCIFGDKVEIARKPNSILVKKHNNATISLTEVQYVETISKSPANITPNLYDKSQKEHIKISLNMCKRLWIF